MSCCLVYVSSTTSFFIIIMMISLPNGVLRLQPKGGHGHHNGSLLNDSCLKSFRIFLELTSSVKSVMGHLDGGREFPRLCIGIGNPPGAMDMKAYLLQKFSPAERNQRRILNTGYSYYLRDESEEFNGWYF
ncbi:chloroplastic group IIB intron splicing facilitator CRS2-B, chloroplastic-like isoform X1 [Gossypium arboreum]|uniref:chloroplastic group IIB intron splicing facilitator CRS2-B, chloroplastic-like isoform X1 n=1 Tax=Gossypium arboreum TaxID=29729 RepID=UPI0022F17BBA|nr:chloroplastic group IIB intron splicing facilitator CRS2-B, chloroplastic-like isoform X1 [Gossypium arboreum]